MLIGGEYIWANLLDWPDCRVCRGPTVNNRYDEIWHPTIAAGTDAAATIAGIFALHQQGNNPFSNCYSDDAQRCLT